MKPTMIFLICFFIFRTAVHSQVISFEIDESKFKTELLPSLDTSAVAGLRPVTNRTRK